MEWYEKLNNDEFFICVCWQRKRKADNLSTIYEPIV
jgi:hypothetical protein